MTPSACFLIECLPELLLGSRSGPGGRQSKAVPHDTNKEIVVPVGHDLGVDNGLGISSKLRDRIRFPANDFQNNALAWGDSSVGFVNDAASGRSLPGNVTRRGEENTNKLCLTRHLSKMR